MYAPIITFTMNPAVDTFGETERIFEDSKTRCQQTRQEPGGGGINVARNIIRMGTPALAIFPAGGLNGELLKQLLARDNTPYQSISIASDTRQNLAITERYCGKMYHFVFPGPELTKAEQDACRNALLEHQQLPEFLVLSGSIADCVPASFYGEITKKASALGIKVVLDTSGAALQGALYNGAYVAKLNRKEFSSLGYSELDDIATLRAQMREIMAKGAVSNLIVTLAQGGALLITESGEELAYMPPKVEIISHVGAGDSFVSALTHQLYQGKSLDVAFRYGVAAASVTVQTKGNQLYDLDLLEVTYKKTQPLA
ncbi:hexose kinase, 1-phosphofructokinase family [Idiomarina sp. A28L]|uniref:1-phosphofructokinase family hexose kinase n=1 Tax=Idiomarina sp. A28L TaxID=1036674 RepID=UPI0002138A26|nr:1-phosphofructokinase family hexose kinase [Idiomarina sp. A28L]EGN75004.1 hexose kinase, 1-phosphofructokinase family [Idiomarina sp. A28L]